MLRIATTFPHVGSYGLLIDANLPVDQRRAELIRIFGLVEAEGTTPLASISLPLRTGASGTRIVELQELIDGTPLTKAEERELADTESQLRGRRIRSARQKADQARCEELRSRLCFSQLLSRELEKLGRLERRAQPSAGAYLRAAA